MKRQINQAPAEQHRARPSRAVGQGEPGDILTIERMTIDHLTLAARHLGRAAQHATALAGLTGSSASSDHAPAPAGVQGGANDERDIGSMGQRTDDRSTARAIQRAADDRLTLHRAAARYHVQAARNHQKAAAALGVPSSSARSATLPKDRFISGLPAPTPDREPHAQSEDAEGKQAADAKRFVEDSLKDPKLVSGYASAAQAANAKSDPRILSDFLTQHGYQTTPTAIKEAFTAFQSQDIRAWTGIYGTAVIQTQDGNRAQGPYLIVQNDGQVLLGGQKLVDVEYDDKRLQWQKGKNQTGGAITMSDAQSSTDTSQHIHQFAGTLERDDGTVQYAGRIGPLSAHASGAPSAAMMAKFQEAMRVLGYGMTIFFAAEIAWRGIKWAGAQAKSVSEADKGLESADEPLETRGQADTDKTAGTDEKSGNGKEAEGEKKGESEKGEGEKGGKKGEKEADGDKAEGEADSAKLEPSSELAPAESSSGGGGLLSELETGAKEVAEGAETILPEVAGAA